MTNTMHGQRAQTRTPENEEAHAVAAALGFKGLSTTSDEYCARRLSAVQPLSVSAHGSECRAAHASHVASMPCWNRGGEGAGNVARMARIALSLAQHSFRLCGTGEGWRIEPHRLRALKDQNGERA